MSFRDEMNNEATFRFKGENDDADFFDVKGEDQENTSLISEVTDDFSTGKKVAKNQDQNVAHETIKILAYLLNNSYDHPNPASSNTTRRDHFFFRSHIIQMSNGDVTKGNILEMLGTTCGLLEMMLRHNIIDRAITYDTVGSTLTLLLLKVIDRCLERKTHNQSQRQRKVGVDSSESSEEEALAILKSSEIIFYFSQIPSARVRMANIPGVLSSLVNLAEHGSTKELRLYSFKTITNLAIEKENRVMILEQDKLIDTIVDELVNLDMKNIGGSQERNLDFAIPEQAVNILLNLSLSKINQNKLASDSKIIELFLDILGCQYLSTKMQRSVTECFPYLAQSKENAMKLFSYENGVIVGVMLDITLEERKDKELACHALETIRLMSLAETTQWMVSYPQLISTVTNMACACKDNGLRSTVAAAVLKRFATHINLENETGLDLNQKQQEIHHTLISSLIYVILNVENNLIDVIQLISEALVIQTERPENRDYIMSHEILFTAMRKVSEIKESKICGWAACTVLVNLANVSHNRTLFACEEVTKILCNLVNRKYLDAGVKQQVVSLINDLTSSPACQKLMRNNEDLMVGLMKQSIQVSDTPKNETSKLAQETILSLMENGDDDTL